ncbi:MAG: MoaD/ThiS family protein [Chloroflexi bacterium]|nr:MoaD/ThiS family protein [Chloroflexota bacterium]
MAVKVKVSSLLRKYTNWQEFVEVEGRTPLECLHAIEKQFPSIKRLLYDKQGKLRPQFWFFVNGQKINAGELTSPLKDGDELMILLAISGG